MEHDIAVTLIKTAILAPFIALLYWGLMKLVEYFSEDDSNGPA